MELKLVKNIMAAIEINSELLVNFENSVVYENIGEEEVFLYIRSNTPEGKEVKMRFIKKVEPTEVQLPDA
jgi:hypothetical protein